MDDVEMLKDDGLWKSDTYESYSGDGDDGKQFYDTNMESSDSEKPLPKSTRVIIENLPVKIQWQALKDLIKEHVSPEVQCFVDMVRDSGGRYTGEGIVNFNKVEIAAKAIEKLNGITYEGQQLIVKEESDSPSRKRRRSRSNSPKSQSKKIIVSNIPYSTTWQQLKDYFRENIGPVDYAEVDVAPNGVAKGTGLVSFHDVSKAREAIEKTNNSEFLGRKIHVREENERDRQPSGPASFPQVNIDQRLLQYLGVNEPPTNTVYVGNLEQNTQWQKVKDVFRLAGSVSHVKMLCDNENRQRGIAIVQFDTAYDALQAIAMLNGCEFFGRPLYVRMYTETLDRQINMSHRQHPDLPPGLGRVGMNLQALQSRLQGMGSGGMGGGNMSDLAGMAYMLQSLFSGAGGVGGYGGGYGGGGYGSTGGGYGSGYGGGYNTGNQKRTQDPSRPTCTVCVENLDRSVTWQALKDRFKPIGNVLFADLVKQNGRPTGCALVKFSTPDDAARAVMLMNGVKFEGKNLNVYLDN